MLIEEEKNNTMINWLNQIKKCHIVQLEFSPLINWEIQNLESIEEIIKTTKMQLIEKNIVVSEFNIDSYIQKIITSKIDLLGLKISNGIIYESFLLNFDNLTKNKKNLKPEQIIDSFIEDLLLIITINKGFVNPKITNIICVYPEITSKMLTDLKKLVSIINNIYLMEGLNINIQIYEEQQFINNIMEELRKDEKSNRLMSKKEYKSFANNSLINENKDVKYDEDNDKSEKKIGTLVRDTFMQLINNNNLTKDRINKLTDVKYSKNTFDINFPVLKRVELNTPFLEQRQVKGYSRYYSHRLKIMGEEYFLCNDWYERNRTHFNKWVRSL